MLRRLIFFCFCVAIFIQPSFAQGIGGTLDYVPGFKVGAPYQSFPLPYPPATTGYLFNAYNSLIATKQFNLFLPTDTFSFVYSQNYTSDTPKLWRVLDINGNTVSQGAFTISNGGTLTIPQISKFGYYEITLIGSEVDQAYGNSYGGTLFGVVPHDSIIPDPGNSGNNQYCLFPDTVTADTAIPALHALCQTGPIRWKCEATTTGAATTEANNVAANIAYDQAHGWLSIAADPQRPRIHMVSFDTYGLGGGSTAAVVTQEVSILGTSCVYECTNEPNGFFAPNDYYNDVWVPFYNAVKAGNASAQVIGPAVVSFSAYAGSSGLPWQDTFFSNTLKIDQVSTHPYSCVIGQELQVCDALGPQFISMLHNHGADGLPRWCSEVGTNPINDYGCTFYKCFGESCMWSLLQLEYLGIPLERQVFFKDDFDGFWGDPSTLTFGIGSDPATNNPYWSATPNALASRNMAIQLRHTIPTSMTQLDFGSANFYARGYQYQKADGTYVTFLGAPNMESLPITISGATSAYDMYGNAISGINGTTNLSNAVISVQSSAPLTISDIGNGLISATNIASSATPFAPAAQSQANLSAFNDNALGSLYVPNGNTPYSDTNNIMPAIGGLTWTSAHTIDRFGFVGTMAYQQGSAPITFSVQALVGGNWQTVYTFDNSANATSRPFASSWMRCGMESAYDKTYRMTGTFTPVSATGLRIVMSRSSFGPYPDFACWYNIIYPQAQQAGGALPKGRLCVNELQAFTN